LIIQYKATSHVTGRAEHLTRRNVFPNVWNYVAQVKRDNYLLLSIWLYLILLYCGYLIIVWLFLLGISCTVFVLICTVVVLYCFVMCWCVCVGFLMCGRVCVCVCVCVCVDFVMCGCFGNMYTVLWQVFLVLAEIFLVLTEVFLTLTEVFPCFFLIFKTNARVKLAKTGHVPHSSKLVVICVVLLLFVFFPMLFACKCVLYYCHRVTT